MARPQPKPAPDVGPRNAGYFDLQVRVNKAVELVNQGLRDTPPGRASDLLLDIRNALIGPRP